MIKKHNPHCLKCGNNNTIKKGSRNGLKRYFCKNCKHNFHVNHRPKRSVIWIPYVDGIPIRKLGNELEMSPSQTYEHVKAEMMNLPDNTWITNKYGSRYSGILIVDGKFVKVKGFKKKIPFIYAIDYLTHDILVGILVKSECFEAYLKLFRLLKTTNYPLRVVGCDDVLISLKPALNYYYPKAKVQLCQNHYLENMRQKLKVRTSRDHVKFFNNLKLHVFDEYKNVKQLKAVLHHFIISSAKRNILRQEIVMDIWHRRQELFVYQQIPHCPKNTNLIELFNSHLNARLKSIKGFKSLPSAEMFLNAWMIRRRTKSFTDCKTKFKYLNGKCSLQMTIKKQAGWPNIYGVKAPETER